MVENGVISTIREYFNTWRPTPKQAEAVARSLAPYPLACVELAAQRLYVRGTTTRPTPRALLALTREAHEADQRRRAHEASEGGVVTVEERDGLNRGTLRAQWEKMPMDAKIDALERYMATKTGFYRQYVESHREKIVSGELQACARDVLLFMQEEKV